MKRCDQEVRDKVSPALLFAADQDAFREKVVESWEIAWKSCYYSPGEMSNQVEPVRKAARIPIGTSNFLAGGESMLYNQIPGCLQKTGILDYFVSTTHEHMMRFMKYSYPFGQIAWCCFVVNKQEDGR